MSKIEIRADAQLPYSPSQSIFILFNIYTLKLIKLIFHFDIICLILIKTLSKFTSLKTNNVSICLKKKFKSSFNFKMYLLQRKSNFLCSKLPRHDFNTDQPRVAELTRTSGHF